MSRDTTRWTAALAGALALLAAAPVGAAGTPPSPPEPPPAPPAGVAPMTTANRTTGVAPLPVFFDCVDTVPSGAASPFAWTSGVHQPPDGDYEAVSYVWDFGDASAGTWGTTGSSRNRATGYTAAHVYETPGAYRATLSVTTKSGAVHTYQQSITVVPFGGATFFVAAGGSDANDGRSERSPFATVAKGIAAVNGGPNRRLLLKRGDAFTTPGVALTAGPGIVGAYGVGARPILNVTGRSDGIAIRGADWRVMDLDLVYATAERNDPSGVSFVPGFQTVNTLVLRVRTTRFRVGILNTLAARPGAPHDGDAFVDCEVVGAWYCAMYVGGRRIAVLGCDLHDTVASHVLRMWQGHKAVVSSNRLWNPGPTRHAFKFHGPHHEDGRPETRWATVSDNLVRGKAWSVAIGPEDNATDSRISHVVYERNRHYPEASVGVDLLIEGCQSVLARNNVFDGSGAFRSYRAIRIARRGVEPVPDGIRVLHNTVVRNDHLGGSFRGVEIWSGSTNVTVRGNLMAAPLGGGERLALDDAGAGDGLLARDNLLTTPEAASFEDLSGGDFTPTARSVAVDAGAALPEVRTDFRGAPRPRGRAPDLGALESR